MRDPGRVWFWELGHRQSISVLDESEDARTRREDAIKSGTPVAPFGFARALWEEPEPPEWLGNPS